MLCFEDEYLQSARWLLGPGTRELAGAKCDWLCYSNILGEMGPAALRFSLSGPTLFEV